jgi:hypothetical protein
VSADEPEGFARRWSRLKRQPAEPVPAQEVAVEAAAPPVEVPPDATTIPLEDITAWLGRNIPEGWREIALRRIWSADVSIRDFIGPADYAWDWNTPGGAPGWGPMRAADDMMRLLSRAIGEDLPKPAAPVEDPVIALAEPAGDVFSALQDPAPGALPPSALPPDALPPDDLPPVQLVQEMEPRAVRPRRGGRATPV